MVYMRIQGVKKIACVVLLAFESRRGILKDVWSNFVNFDGEIRHEPAYPRLQPTQMRALWKDFVQKTFRKTNFRTTFNGMMRNVYRDDSHLIVLDEWHGDLELLAMQAKPGAASHVGSQEIDIVSTSPSPQFRRGKLTMKGKHNYVLMGSL